MDTVTSIIARTIGSEPPHTAGHSPSLSQMQLRARTRRAAVAWAAAAAAVLLLLQAGVAQPSRFGARHHLDSASRMAAPRRRMAGGSAGLATIVSSPPADEAAAWGLNAKAFGAVGDGVADDAKALTAAIAAATREGQPLILPAGTYRVNSTVSVPANVGKSVRFGSPLRLIGDGYTLSKIVAAEPMHAVLNFSCLSGPTEGAAAPIPMENVYVADLEISANGKANFSIFAPGIARSRFERLEISGALTAGISVGYGWCNYVEGCRFGGNEIGLHTYNSANNIDVIDSIFEGNTGVGYYISGGAQINVEGCVIEGNGGPGIVVMGAVGVQLASNYFEANNGYAGRPFVHMRPALDNTTAPVIKLTSDIVLNGAPSFHDGNSDYRSWGPIDWTYGRAYCPSSVVVQGNTHAPCENCSAVFVVCGSGLSFTGNVLSLEGKKNMAYVETGSDSSLFGATQVFFKANSLKHHEGPAVVGQMDRLIRLLPTTKPYNGGVGLQNWHVEDSPTLHRRQNFIRYDRVTAAGADVLQAKDAIKMMQATQTGCTMMATGREMDRYSIVSIGIGNTSSQCEMTITTIDISKRPELVGQPVYVLVQANVTLSDTSVALSIDPSDGSGARISSDWDQKPGMWQMLEYQMMLGQSGVAHFGLKIASSNAKRETETVVDIAAMVVAKVGDEWSQLP